MGGCDQLHGLERFVHVHGPGVLAQTTDGEHEHVRRKTLPFRQEHAVAEIEDGDAADRRLEAHGREPRSLVGTGLCPEREAEDRNGDGAMCGPCRLDRDAVERDGVAGGERVEVLEGHPRRQRASARIDDQGAAGKGAGQALAADHVGLRGPGDTIGVPMVIGVAVGNHDMRDGRPF